MVISGIGCASRFPYYMNTYGMHTIHGRAPAFATGIKSANPELSVWLVTGDGDGLSIGATTCCTCSGATSRSGSCSSTTESTDSQRGSTARPLGQHAEQLVALRLNRSPDGPIRFALGADASFVARVIDVDAKYFQKILRRAAMHRGATFIEIYQNCPIFNDGAYISSRTRSRGHSTRSIWNTAKR